jgi:hypothetical protein
VKEGPDGKGLDDKIVTFDPKRKLKELKLLKQRQPRQPMTLKEALVQSLQEDKENQAEHFDQCYARLLRVQARLASAFLERDDAKREALTDKLQDREEAALWDVIGAQAVHRWQIARKLQLLEQIMHLGVSWYDQREFFMLASARMDLERLEPRKATDKTPAEKGA